MNREMGAIELAILVAQRKEITKRTPDDHTAYDKNRDLILFVIKNSFELLTFEEIMEAYSHLGSAPCLIYDDNGNWAITDEGMNNVRTEDTQNLDYGTWVEARFFKPTIREALEYWIDNRE